VAQTVEITLDSPARRSQSVCAAWIIILEVVTGPENSLRAILLLNPHFRQIVAQECAIIAR